MRALFILLVFLSLFSNQLLAQAPAFSWASNAGSVSNDIGSAIAVDNNGNSYSIGNFEGPAMTIGSTTLTNSGSLDIFIAKYDLSGNPLWAIKAGGPHWDSGFGIATDNLGNCYVTGRIETNYGGNITFGNIPITDTVSGFVSKIDASGNIVWLKLMTLASGHRITVDGFGNIYVTGINSDGATFGNIVLTNPNQTMGNVFLAKYDPSGNEVWVKQGATSSSGSGTGNAEAISRGIGTDANGNIYVMGSLQGNVDFNGIVLNGTGSILDNFFVKYDPSGNVLWVKRVGGFDTSSQAIAVDPSGNSFITGEFYGTVNFGAIPLTSLGLSDAYIVKYDPSGNVVWANRVGNSSEGENGYGIAVDAVGNSIMASRFWGTITVGTITLTESGQGDGLIVKYNASGSPVWAEKSGGSGGDIITYITVDAAGNAYMTGGFESAALFGTINLTSIGNGDFYVAKLGNAPLAASNQLSTSSFTLAPNPAHSLVRLSNFSQPIRYSLYNFIGKEVLSQSLSVSAKEVVLPIHNLSPGLYALQLHTIQGIQSSKLVIE